jgi:hypothetical protein
MACRFGQSFVVWTLVAALIEDPPLHRTVENGVWKKKNIMYVFTEVGRVNLCTTVVNVRQCYYVVTQQNPRRSRGLQYAGSMYDFCNPKTATQRRITMGFTAMMLPTSETWQEPRLLKW